MGTTEDSEEIIEASFVNQQELHDDNETAMVDPSSNLKVEAKFSSPEEVPLRTQIFIMLEVPNSSRAALYISMVINLMILLSTTTFVIETMPELADVDQAVWSSMEITCVVGFTLDFVLRLGCTPDLKDFWTDFMNWIDFIAIVPFYIIVIIKWTMDMDMSDTILGKLRVLRVLRLVRILKVFKSNEPDATDFAELVGGIAFKSLGALTIPGYFMFSTLVILSAMVYYFEKGNPVTCDSVCGQNETECETDIYSSSEDRWTCCYCVPLYGVGVGEFAMSDNFFQSLPDAYYWGIVTMTTVGYGDQYPITWLGRTVGAVVILGGLFFVAMPLTTVGFIFNQDYEETRAKEIKKEKRERDLKLLLEMHREITESGSHLSTLLELSGGSKDQPRDKQEIEKNFDAIKDELQLYSASTERVQDEILDIFDVFSNLDV